jgi:hypothetical protein
MWNEGFPKTVFLYIGDIIDFTTLFWLSLF